MLIVTNMDSRQLLEGGICVLACSDIEHTWVENAVVLSAVRGVQHLHRVSCRIHQCA